MPDYYVQYQAGTPSKVAVRRFLRYTQRFSSLTQRHYKDTLWRFFSYMPPTIENLSPEHIERFLQSLPILNSSKNAHLTPIRSFCKYLEDYYDIPNKAEKVKSFKEEPPKQRFLTEDEYSRILSICKPDEKAVVQLLANTGLRASELCNLTPQNISHDQKYLTIVGKGRKCRTIPLNENCRKIFSSYFSKSYNRDSLYYLCKKLSRKAGIPIAGPHSYRHFFATRLIQKGVPIAKVSRILGHSSIKTTEQIYLHWLPHDLLGATDCLLI